MGVVTINQVRKAYGAVEVLHGVSIDIANGEFVVLVGPSGCGKSTLLRMLAGLEDITGGEIAIDGRVINGLQPKARDIAMVFQSYALYPHMTVEQNIGFSLKLAGTNKVEARAQIAKIAQMVSMDAYLDRYPRQLSGGQRQRVAMGRAMIRNPKVFLFDEPLSNLDAKLRVQMRSEIKQNHQKLQTTTIYVTHDQVEALTMADKIVVMHDGAVEQIGTPLDLYDYPDNLFVAGFIGSPSMNFLDGTVQQGCFIALDGTRVRLPDTQLQAAGESVRLGIRPEHLVLDPGGFPAKILTVEPTGSETQVLLQLAGQNVIGIFRERIANRPGEILGLSLQPDRIHLFDAKSGQRLTMNANH